MVNLIDVDKLKETVKTVKKSTVGIQSEAMRELIKNIMDGVLQLIDTMPIIKET